MASHGTTENSGPRQKTAPLVTTRIGVVFVIVAACVFTCALVANGSPQGNRIGSTMWVLAIACCSVGGFVTMNSVRTLRTIEKELRRRKDDQRQWQTVRPILGEDPVTLGWNQLLEDAAAQHDERQEERTLATLDHEVVTLARAMRHLPVAWVITDAEGMVRFLGPATSNLLSLSADDSNVGVDLLEILGIREDAEELARVLGPIRMLHSRRQVTLDLKSLHLRITRSRLGGRSGDSEGLAWIIQDVTQQQLATEARDQFLMTATHELRTPLTNLQAYAEALHEEDVLEIERQKEFCNVINSESIRLGRLVDQLLTVSQMEAGSMVSNRHELELLPMLEYAVDHIRAQADQKQMTLTTNLAAKLPVALGDRDKLQAALANLVGNAVKYTPDGGTVSLRCSADERWIQIDVEDNGPGIPEEEQGKVFDKFYRGAENQTEQRGNGLGLAFAREIARLHGGDIQLQSTVGEGCVFTMRLPVAGRSRSGV